MGVAEAVDEAVAATTVVAAIKAAVVDADTTTRMARAPTMGAKAKALTMGARGPTGKAAVTAREHSTRRPLIPDSKEVAPWRATTTFRCPGP